jgi:hypothetical protein
MTVETVRRAQVAGAVVGLAGVVFVLARLFVAGDVLDRVWAEDGAVFLVDAREHGVGSLFYEYSGYGHLVPRVLALFGAWLPLGAYASFVTLASAVVAGYLAWYVFGVAQRVTSSVMWGVVASLALVLVPAYRSEALGNLANLQWFLLPAAVWAVVDPQHRKTLAVVVVLAAATTSPLAILVVPTLFLVHGRTGWRHPVLLALGAGLLWQALVRFVGPGSMKNPAPREPGFYTSMVLDVFRQAGGVESLVLGVVMVGALVATWVLAGRQNRVAGGLLIASVLFVVVPSMLNGSVQPRYVACGFAILVGAVCVVAPKLARVPAAVLGVVLLAGTAVGFAVDPYRVSGPVWSAEVESPCADHVRDVRLSPDGWGAIRLSC